MLRFGVFGYWANSYWGGNVAAIGGALLLGALPRIKSSARWQDATLMGLGLALLANSRPWEGLVLSLPVAAMLLWWMFGKNRPPLRTTLRTVALPIVVVLAMTGGWLMYYCWRTTGSPVRTPYQVYEETYGAVPVMVWQHVRPVPVYRNAVLPMLLIDQDFAEYHSPFIFRAVRMLVAPSLFFFGPLLLAPAAVLAFVLPYGFGLRDLRRETRALLGLLAFSLLSTLLVTYYNVHYSAPAVPIVVGLILCLIRTLRESAASGLALCRLITVAIILVFGVRVAATPLHITPQLYSTYYYYQFFETHPKGWFNRSMIKSELADEKEQQLVIVRYQPSHLVHTEWVYNDADIGHSKIVWARDMGPEKNQELIHYYKDRTAWLLEADEDPARLIKYENAGDATKQGTAPQVAPMK